MVVVAQLVRASVCGTEGRGFESRLPPWSFKKNPDQILIGIFVLYLRVIIFHQIKKALDFPQGLFWLVVDFNCWVWIGYRS